MKQVKVLFGDRKATAFMHDCDVFERSKVVSNPLCVADVVDNFGDSNIEAILKACEGEPYFLIAIYDDNRTYYRNPDVKSVSNGVKFRMLDDVLP